MVSQGGFIAYYRVSTGKQGKSGLGIEAQRAAVENYLNGGNWRITAEFTEIESGKRSDRPELTRALAAARLHHVPVVVAKVDRLTRSVAFLSRLLEAGVDVRFAVHQLFFEHDDFLVADFPAEEVSVGAALEFQKEAGKFARNHAGGALCGDGSDGNVLHVGGSFGFERFVEFFLGPLACASFGKNVGNRVGER